MDYGDLKRQVVEISDIAKQVPAEFQARCFELLLTTLLESPGRQGEKQTEQVTPPPETNGHQEVEPGTIPTPSTLRVFMQRTGVTTEELATILMFDEGEVHFLREPQGQRVATGQIEWALLLALKNGIENNRLAADPEAVRSICQEKGFYDKKNFAGNFKKPSNAKLFKKALVPQGDSEPLTNPGQDELGKLVKRLAGSSA